jgi:uncharacterized membrane protein YhiD involved in acid resistance
MSVVHRHPPEGPGRVCAALAGLLLFPAIAAAQGSIFENGVGTAVHPFDLAAQLLPVRHAVVSLPLACLLGAALSFRPRRRGTPPRSSAVIQTQVILAVVGAIVMLVVGTSVARAFGIVGVASLIRYRAKVDNPKDAGVMLAALGVGLASGVGLHLFAVFATLFLLATLWMLESFEPRAQRVFHLKVAFDGTPPKTRVEDLLRRLKVDYELRSASEEDLCYEVRLPLTAETDRLSSALIATAKATAVEWEPKSPKSGP